MTSASHLLKPVWPIPYTLKGDIVVALRAGLLTCDAVTAAHGVTADDVARWMAQFDRGGHAALRTRPAQKARAA